MQNKKNFNISTSERSSQIINKTKWKKPSLSLIDIKKTYGGIDAAKTEGSAYSIGITGS